jgi:hypothetical protein
LDEHLVERAARSAAALAVPPEIGTCRIVGYGFIVPTKIAPKSVTTERCRPPAPALFAIAISDSSLTVDFQAGRV